MFLLERENQFFQGIRRKRMNVLAEIFLGPEPPVEVYRIYPSSESADKQRDTVQECLKALIRVEVAKQLSQMQSIDHSEVIVRSVL